MKVLVALVVCAFALIAAPADARVVQHPEAGGPGVTIDIPDTWTTRVSGRNLIIGNDTRTLGFSITVGQAAPEYDTIAGLVRPEGATPLVRGEDAIIDGRAAAVFNATMSGNGGAATLTVRMFELGGGYLASISQITRTDAPLDAIAEAEAALLSVRVVE